MANGFGGALAAPIWHDFMSVASNGFCGDWGAPSNPFSGTAFSGPHSSATYPGSGSSSGPSSGPNSGGGTSNQYNNPTLFAQPPQPPPAPTNTGGAGVSSGGGGASGGGASGGGTHSGGGTRSGGGHSGGGGRHPGRKR
jgi:hypothetical protein